MATDDRGSSAISPSQEDDFLHSGFITDSDSSLFSAGDDEPLGSSVSATPIVMESLPESPHQGAAAADGHFETPPEDFASTDGSQNDRCFDTVPTNGSVAMAVEPGQDADLEFPKSTEVESSERGPKEARVHKRGSSSDSGSPLKRSNLKTSESSLVEKVANLGLPSDVVKIINLFDMLAPKSSVNAPSPIGEENAGCHAQNVVEAGGNPGGRKSRKTKGSLKQDLLAMVEATMRVTDQLLPESGAQQANSRESDARSTVEIAKSRGMKFPRPEHWPPGKEV